MKNKWAFAEEVKPAFILTWATFLKGIIKMIWCGTNFETIFNQKLLVSLTKNDKETASNTELNVKFWCRKTEMVLTFKNQIILVYLQLYRFFLQSV